MDGSRRGTLAWSTKRDSSTFEIGVSEIFLYSKLPSIAVIVVKDIIIRGGENIVSGVSVSGSMFANRSPT